MRNISEKIVERINTHVSCLTIFPKILPFLDNVEKYGIAPQATDDNVIWRLRFAYKITKATHRHTHTDTHTQTHTHTHTLRNVILFPFSLQLLHKRPSMLLYTYLACLVKDCLWIWSSLKNFILGMM